MKRKKKGSSLRKATKIVSILFFSFALFCSARIYHMGAIAGHGQSAFSLVASFASHIAILCNTISYYIDSGFALFNISNLRKEYRKSNATISKETRKKHRRNERRDSELIAIVGKKKSELKKIAANIKRNEEQNHRTPSDQRECKLNDLRERQREIKNELLELPDNIRQAKKILRFCISIFIAISYVSISIRYGYKWLLHWHDSSLSGNIDPSLLEYTAPSISVLLTPLAVISLAHCIWQFVQIWFVITDNEPAIVGVLDLEGEELFTDVE
jgi:hypothetical protein